MLSQYVIASLYILTVGYIIINTTKTCVATRMYYTASVCGDSLQMLLRINKRSRSKRKGNAFLSSECIRVYARIVMFEITPWSLHTLDPGSKVFSRAPQHEASPTARTTVIKKSVDGKKTRKKSCSFFVLSRPRSRKS